MSILTNLGKNAISSALGSETKLNLVKIGFGDKLGNINKVFTESDISLVNEKIRMNLDTVTYSDVTGNNNSIITITAVLTPEQSFNMEAITIREFGIYDNTNKLIIVGNTVPTITRDESNSNGINFEISIVLPTTENIVRIINNCNEFNEAFKNKLNKIEEEATKNKPDDFLLNRENHTGLIKIEDVEYLEEVLSQLVTIESFRQALGEKVTVVPGKDLSSNDYTDDDKNKLDNIIANSNKILFEKKYFGGL